MERGPNISPHSIEAEKSVLGSMLIAREAAELACELLRAEDFYVPAHQDIFAAMAALAQRGSAVDSVTVVGLLERENKLSAVGNVGYITELSLFVPSAANIGHYIKIVEERSVLRQLARAGGEIVRDVSDASKSVDELLEESERRIFSISMKKSNDTLIPIATSAMSAFDRISELMKLKGSISGVPTGFGELDALTGGLQKSDLVIVAGRPSMGKTTFALNIAQYAATRGKKTVCIFSLEMSDEQLARRMLCANAGVDMQKVNMGDLDNDSLISLAEALDEISGARIFIDDAAGINVAEIRSRCRRQKTRGGLDLVIIDYLQLIELPGGSSNRVGDISEVTRSLKILARELEAPIILLSQLSRGPENRTTNAHRPVMSDLRESGAIEQDADLIMLLYRPAVYADKEDFEAQNDNTAEIIVAKHRNGPTGTIELIWQSQYTRFANRSPKEE